MRNKITRQFISVSDQKSQTPKLIYEYLNKYVIGQEEAKKSIAIAYRNRWRRSNLNKELQMEIFPKNILFSGPTGCGKTEIARKLAQLSNCPFLKVEATKFTEIGYHGKDVDTIIQDLVKNAIKKEQQIFQQLLDSELKSQIQKIVAEQIIDGLLGVNYLDEFVRKEKLQQLEDGWLDEKVITIEIPQEFDAKINYKNTNEAIESFQTLKFFGNYQETEKQVLTIANAKQLLYDVYVEKLTNEVNFKQLAIDRVEQEGVVFIDEIDKLAVPQNTLIYGKSPSTDGVQRDLLPLIEGTIVKTKYGDVKTDHILFIAGGAFSQSKPQDLMPELLGRLPIRIELKSLTKQDFIKILSSSEYNLIFQQKKLFESENIQIEFTDDGIDYIAEFAFEQNKTSENIGARRLHSVIEKIMEDVSFNCPDFENKQEKIMINKKYVSDKLQNYAQITNLKKYLI